MSEPRNPLSVARDIIAAEWLLRPPDESDIERIERVLSSCETPFSLMLKEFLSDLEEAENE